MKDRVPKYPGRVKMTPVPGQPGVYDMERADEPTEPGTPLNKASLLSSETAAVYGLGEDATPDDALRAIIDQDGNVRNGNGELKPFLGLTSFVAGTGYSRIVEGKDSVCIGLTFTPNLDRFFYLHTRGANTGTGYLYYVNTDDVNLTPHYVTANHTVYGSTVGVCDNDTLLVITSTASNNSSHRAYAYDITGEEPVVVSSITMSGETPVHMRDYPKFHSDEVMFFATIVNGTTTSKIYRYNKQERNFTSFTAPNPSDGYNAATEFYPLGDKVLLITPTGSSSGWLRMFDREGNPLYGTGIGSTSTGMAVDKTGGKVYIRCLQNNSGSPYILKSYSLEDLSLISSVNTGETSYKGALFYIDALYDSYGRVYDESTAAFVQREIEVITFTWQVVGSYGVTPASDIITNQYFINVKPNVYAIMSGIPQYIVAGTKVEWGGVAT